MAWCGKCHYGSESMKTPSTRRCPACGGVHMAWMAKTPFDGEKAKARNKGYSKKLRSVDQQAKAKSVTEE